MKAIFNVEIEGFISDGTTPNDGAMTRLKAKMGPRGGRIQFGGGRYYFTSGNSCQFDAPVILEGQGAFPDNVQQATTVLEFAAGQRGITLGPGAACSGVQNLVLRSRSTAIGNDNGLAVRAHAVLIQQVIIELFGHDGVNIDTQVENNANNSTLINVRAFGCRRRGFHISGMNSNVITLLNCDATWSGEFGFYNDAAHGVYLNAHVDANIGGGFWDRGSSNMYVRPYAENNGLFLIDGASNGGRIFCGYYGVPDIQNHAGGGGGWIIESQGGFASGVEFRKDIVVDGTLVLRGSPYMGVFMESGNMIQVQTPQGYQPAFCPRWIDGKTKLSYAEAGLEIKPQQGGQTALFCDPLGRVHVGGAGFVGSKGTAAERDRLPVEEGLEWFDTDRGKKQVFSRGAWVDLH